MIRDIKKLRAKLQLKGLAPSESRGRYCRAVSGMTKSQYSSFSNQPPFTIDGSPFTQAAFSPGCFVLATASGSVSGTMSSCGVDISWWLIDAPGAIRPGSYIVLGNSLGAV